MNKITFLVTLFCVLFINSAKAQTEIIGNKEFGRIFDLTYDLKNQNTVYAITIGTHIVVSHDNGLTWENFYSLPLAGSGYSFSKLKISSDGTFLSFVRAENDNGILEILDIPTKTITKTYALPNPSEFPNISSYNFFGSDKNSLIVTSQFPFGAGVANRVFITIDGALNWKEVYYSVDHSNIITNDVAFSPANRNKIYIANGLGNSGVYGGLLLSEDGGNTFTEKLSGDILGVLAINPNNAEEIYAGSGISFGFTSERLFQSKDGGETWENKNITFGTNGILNNIMAIEYDPSDSNHVIVLEEDEIISTKDGGITWQSVEYPYENLDSYYYGTKLSFNPFKAGELVITSNFKPLFSTDDTATLTQIKTPFFFSTGHVGLFENSTSKNLYYSVQGGFVYRNLMDDTEVAHDIVPHNIVINNNGNIYITDLKKAGRLYSFSGGFNGSTLSVSDDFGANFNSIFETSTSQLTDVITDPQITNQIWATFNNFDQGELDVINFNDLNNIIATNIPLPTQNPVYKILHPNNISNEFLLLIGSEVYKTIDGGTNWTPVFIGNEITSNSKIFDIIQNPKNVNHLALGTSEGVYISKDKGITWNKSSNFVTNKIAYSDMNSGVLIAATYTSLNEIFNINYSENNGMTWKAVARPDLLETEGNSVTFDFSDRQAFIYVASNGLGLLKYNLNFNILGNSETSTVDSKVLIYPNPAIDVVHINAKNLKSVELYAMDGKKLLETKNREINISNLPKGIYILQIITSDDSVVSKKLIKK